MSDCTLFPDEITRCIDIAGEFFPEDKVNLVKNLSYLLQPFLKNVSDLPAWHLSRLTSRGYPLEFAFTSANDGIRYTLEIAPPSREIPERLLQLRNVLQSLDISVDETRFDLLSDWQAKGTLKYGGWLGVRHRCGHTQHKIYVEIPPESSERVYDYINPYLALPIPCKNLSMIPKMVGVYPETGALEFYFNVMNMCPKDMVSLLSPLQLASRAQEILTHLQGVYGKPMFNQLPGPLFGFSYTLQSGSATTFTFYTFTRVLFGLCGQHTRHNLLRYYSALNLDMSYYEKMSDPAHRKQNKNYHGLFGLSISGEQALISHIGLSP